MACEKNGNQWNVRIEVAELKTKLNQVTVYFYQLNYTRIVKKNQKQFLRLSQKKMQNHFIKNNIYTYFFHGSLNLRLPLSPALTIPSIASFTPAPVSALVS